MALIPTQPPRALTPAEIAAANTVFANTIDFTTVRITNALGFGNAYWVSPPLPPVNTYFLMHMGNNFFNTPDPTAPIFMHELTHVWQGQRMIPFEYLLNSGAHQGLSTVTTGSTGSAYNYGDSSEQKQWYQYNAEQQASIVQHWYSPIYGNQSSFDWRYRYISGNIRTGNPYASTSPVPPFQQFQVGTLITPFPSVISRRI